ncbi:MAG: alpha/beta hydrolase [Chloroflexi bacterium]|nr:alpha/beta hydrolase [Chloroflexota bacterium]MQC19508.1 alpha/beta hydrolase [Chloroflexota bacterium]
MPQVVADYREALAAAAEAAGIAPPAIVVPEDREVTLGGLRFHYLDWGNAELSTVVLLHGGSQTAHTWDVAALLLRERYHLVALDQRGHGDSEWTPDPEQDTTPLMVEDTRAFLAHVEREHPGASPLVLVGMSMGGGVALRYAAESPPALRALVIVDVAPETIPRGGEGMRRFRAETETLDRFEDFLERAVRFNPDRPEAHLRYSLLHALKQTDDGRWTWKYDPRRHAGEEDGDEAAEQAARETRETRERETWAAVRAIRVPTLFVHGGASAVVAQDAIRRAAEAMHDGRWLSVAGASHTVQGDKPAEFARAVGDFLASLEG